MKKLDIVDEGEGEHAEKSPNSATVISVTITLTESLRY